MFKNISQLFKKIAECNIGWTQFQDHCYRHFALPDHTFTWAEATAECLNDAAHLVSIHSEEEEHFIKGLIPTYASFTGWFPWTGAKFVSDGTKFQNVHLIGNAAQDRTPIEEIVGHWEWEDGSDFDFWNDNYSPSGPDLSGNCVAINNWAAGLWVDTPCDTGHAFVCKKSVLTYHM